MNNKRLCIKLSYLTDEILDKIKELYAEAAGGNMYTGSYCNLEDIIDRPKECESFGYPFGSKSIHGSSLYLRKEYFFFGWSAYILFYFYDGLEPQEYKEKKEQVEEIKTKFAASVDNLLEEINKNYHWVTRFLFKPIRESHFKK